MPHRASGTPGAKNAPKGIFYNREQDEDTEADFNSYGFKSTATPPPADCLTAFENDLYELIRGIQFTRHLNSFQQQMCNDASGLCLSMY